MAYEDLPLPVDTRIRNQLIVQLSKMKADFGAYVSSVVCPDLEIEVDNYPCIILIPETENNLDYFMSRTDELPFTIYYLDGQGESGIRQRSEIFHADLNDCLRSDINLDGLCSHINVGELELGYLQYGDGNKKPCATVDIIIDRSVNVNNLRELA
jgi:hypothetical protein